MGEKFDYESMFAQALHKIKSIRDPHAQKPDTHDLKWDVVLENELFNFQSADYVKYSSVINSANSISISCVNAIITLLFKLRGIDTERIEFKSDDKLLESLVMTVHDKTNKTILFFKKIEECSFWKVKDSEPEAVKRILKEHGAEKCIYIYYMKDDAYLQVIGHNNDESDPGRGYNLYSIQWFFETYFGKEECQSFLSALQNYLSDVNNYLGYILLKSLTPSALVNFRRVTDTHLRKFSYSELLKLKITRTFSGTVKEYSMPEDDYQKIWKQYIKQNVCSVLLGTHDFAESLMTAEWLFDSMKKAQAIDLTVIGTGYFKAIEQLLWELICLHKNENRLIKKDYSRKELPLSIELNDENIGRGAVDSTLGSIATFYKDNMNMLRTDLSWPAKNYLKETIFDYSKLRNGYFHKHNIHDWEIIKSIRSASFMMAFLLLGSHALSQQNLTDLGYIGAKEQSDYYKLCEYINYHSGDLFFVSTGEDKGDIFVGCSDSQSHLGPDGYEVFSGAYIRDLGSGGKKYIITEEKIPKEMYLGKLVFAQSEEVKIEPRKIKKIIEDGAFVGPSIVDEDQMDY